LTAGENQPSSAASPQGRRILVAVVTGAAGACIQAWRETHDPHEARRLPPHTTLCYWAPAVEPALLEPQVRHAFRAQVEVRLGNVREFDNDQQTLYLPVLDAEALDRARERLYDGTHLALPGLRAWTWHVTCVRESRGRDREHLRTAALDLRLDEPWRIDRIAYLELRGDHYQPIAAWTV
jgi:hypothetical protein